MFQRYTWERKTIKRKRVMSHQVYFNADLESIVLDILRRFKSEIKTVPLQ